jgi:hypothetical protein
MNDFELEEIEDRLRRAVSGRGLEPPDDLLDFVEAVPRLHRRRSGVALALGRPAGLARGMALAVAAVVIAALATQAVVVIRSGQPGSGQGWTWYKVDGMSPHVMFRVAQGYVGECGSEPALACSSADGVHWSTPPDPSIASIEGSSVEGFVPENVLEVDGVWLGIPSPTWPGFSFATPVRSTDGVHWSVVRSSVLDELQTANYVQLAKLADRFIYVATWDSGESLAYTSTDGLNWIETGELPAEPGASLGGDAGFFLQSPSQPDRYWRTVDGVTWTRVQLAPFGIPLNVAKIPGGGFVAQGFENGQIIKSDDGLSWHVDQGNLPGYPLELAVVGGRMLVSVSPAPVSSDTPRSAAEPIWGSLDWGKTWQPLLGPGGRQLAGSPVSMGDGAGIIDRSYGLASVGFLDGRSIASPPAATPTAAPTPEPAVATRLPDALRSEWGWQKTDGTYFESEIEVPGGYVATCGVLAGSELRGASLCSSTDGLHWTNPADPRLIAVEAGVSFWPVDAVHVGGVYVAFALQHPLPFPEAPRGSLWRSADGRTWTRIASPELAGFNPSGIGVLAGKFVTLATSSDGRSGKMLTSSDGLSWSTSSNVPVVPNGWSATELGVYVDGNGGTTSRTGDATWLTRNGVDWLHVTVPEGVTDLGGRPVRLSDGSYLDVGFDFEWARRDTLVRSTDGVTWVAVESHLPGRLFGLLGVGDRPVVITSFNQANDPPYGVWQSKDGGATWESLPGPDGYPVTSLVWSRGDSISIVLADGAGPAWVGTLATR